MVVCVCRFNGSTVEMGVFEDQWLSHLLAVAGVSIELPCCVCVPEWGNNLRPRPHLPALALEPPDSLFTPLGSHLERCWKNWLALDHLLAGSSNRAPEAPKLSRWELQQATRRREASAIDDGNQINSPRAPRAGLSVQLSNCWLGMGCSSDLILTSKDKSVK